MMQEQIHDALNYIDDDMIEAVEALRAANAERKKIVNIYRLKPSTFVAAAAACLVIIAATTTLAVSPFLIKMESADTAAPEGAGVYDGGMTTCGSALTGSGTTESGSNTVLVRITSVTESGFMALVLDGYTSEATKDSKDAYGYNASGAGAEYVYVVYSEDMELVENPELSVGSVVKVEYSEIKANKVTAEKIMPEDAKED